MPDPFVSSKRRLARAKKNLRSLKDRGKRFFAKQPHAPVIETDLNSTYDLHCLRFTRRLPPGFTDSVVECAEGLRSCLDLVGYACAVASGRPNAKSAYFPIADDAAGLENVIKGRCKDIPTDIVTLFRGFKPYKGGNDAVWALNRIGNTSKHKLIAPLAMGSDSSFFRYLTMPAGGEVLNPRWDSEKNAIPFLRVPAGSLSKYDLNVSFFVAFGEVDAVAGQPMIPVLYTIASEVERIILATEVEARRIGLIR